MNRGIIFIFIFLVFISGCGLTYQINVNSINAPNADVIKKYILLSGLKDVRLTSLQFREYANYVDKALISRGFIKTDSVRDAKLAIFMRYGIKYLGKDQKTIPFPVWGQTGVSSSTTSGMLSAYGDHGSYHSTTTYLPTYGITGHIPVTITNETYFSFLKLEAYDANEFKRSKNLIQLWKTMVSSYTSKGDLREDMPVLVTAVKPYIGSNTGKTIEIKLNENNKAVMEIKGLTNKK
jgi:hypothetical protein